MRATHLACCAMTRASSNCPPPASRSGCSRSPPPTPASLASRGVVEVESKKVEFGLDGVTSILQAGPASAKDLSQRILRGVQDFMHMAPKHNDVTALTLTRGN